MYCTDRFSFLKFRTTWYGCFAQKSPFMLVRLCIRISFRIFSFVDGDDSISPVISQTAIHDFESSNFILHCRGKRMEEKFFQTFCKNFAFALRFYSRVDKGKFLNEFVGMEKVIWTFFFSLFECLKSSVKISFFFLLFLYRWKNRFVRVACSQFSASQIFRKKIFLRALYPSI